jgi:hypothetical protein
VLKQDIAYPVAIEFLLEHPVNTLLVHQLLEPIPTHRPVFPEVHRICIGKESGDHAANALGRQDHALG